MKISEAKFVSKIAEISLDSKPDDVDSVPESLRQKAGFLRRLNFVFCKDDQELNRSNLAKGAAPRVYLIVVNGEIMKIGASEDKGGIKGTLNIYRTGGINGRPSLRSVGIWYFLCQAFAGGEKVEFYVMYAPTFSARVPGLYQMHDIPDASVSPKQLEARCLEDYHAKERKYPPWNLQEGAADWPKEVRELYNDIIKASDAKSTARGRRIAGRM